MTHQEFDFAYDGTNFYGQYWKATQTRAVVLLIHGMGEHSTRYASYVVPNLLQEGLSVITYDQFGHGKSGGKRGHTPSYEALLDCVAIVSEKSTSFFGNIPTFIYGHSMGGNVAINYVLKRKHQFRGIIATSPFLKLAFKPPFLKLSAGKLLQYLMPSMTLSSALDVNAISRDPNEVNKYVNDVLVHDLISPNYSITVMKMGNWALNNAENLNTSMLLLHGTADRLTSHKASEKFSKKNKLISLKLFKDGYHELHNDYCKDEMISTVLHWTETNLNTINQER